MGISSLFNRIRNSHIFQRLLRVLQFLSATISLGLFSARFYKIYHQIQNLRSATGAVEGILAAATAYTISTLIVNLCLKGGAPTILRWLLIVLDLLFVGAFIAVAYLTRPGGGLGSLCATQSARNNPANQNNPLCALPLGTFGLAIFSTLLHAITAIFHEVKDHRKSKEEELWKEEVGENDYGRAT